MKKALFHAGAVALPLGAAGLLVVTVQPSFALVLTGLTGRLLADQVAASSASLERHPDKPADGLFPCRFDGSEGDGGPPRG